jgi:2-(1,2-epoxy-1,2-dihydrophenyl)acetyl-CoA isomerase
MGYESILFEVSEGIASLTFNRPASLNAFDQAMTAESIDALTQCARDRRIRCVVVTGSGRAFSSGQDLKEVSTRGSEFSIGDHLRRGFNRIVLLMATMEKPVLAAVNGVAAGAGCGIAMAADIRIASDRAAFIQAFSKVGLIPDSGSTWSLTRLIGYGRAFEMAATGDRIEAQKALEWGLVNDVVPAEQLPEITAAWASSLASGPTIAYGLSKRAMNRAMTVSLAEALEYEAQLQEIAGRTADRQEGVTAFMEKREAAFRGE